jgi:hypothetical protein
MLMEAPFLDRPPEIARTPRHGITEWRNPRNGFFVCRLHYTADPQKRTEQWKREASGNLSLRAWRREYEIDWTSPEGEPVVPEFDANRHTRPLEPARDRRLLRFWDFGAVSPVVLFAQLSTYGQLLVLRELCPFNTPLEQLLPSVKAISLDVSIKPDAYDAGDPEGGSQGTLGSIEDALRRHGIHLNMRRPGTELSYAALRDLFLKSVFVPRLGLEPACLISTACPNLIEALSGGFYLSSLPPYRPVKTHPMKDLVDALRYGHDNLAGASGETAVDWKKLASSDRMW